jgi:ADP-ribose pyrophosphatase YjhB (NUDIX family)
MPDYDKVGLLTLRHGKILLCRKQHSTSALILPGGCKEPGESAMDCLARELREELGDVQVSEPEYIGLYSDLAAGSEAEPPKTVQIELYLADLTGEPSPRSEIAELVWFGAGDDRDRLAPSIRNKILPDLLQRGILSWP